MNYREFMKQTLERVMSMWEEKGRDPEALLNRYDPELEDFLKCAWLVHLENGGK